MPNKISMPKKAFVDPSIAEPREKPLGEGGLTPSRDVFERQDDPSKQQPKLKKPIIRIRHTTRPH